jgi:hypothetical protein
MNLQSDFLKWFSQEVPNSYQSWNNDAKLNELGSEYYAAFGKYPFDVDIENINSEIETIQNNLAKRAGTTFETYNKKSGNGIPHAILNIHFIPFLKQYKNTTDQTGAISDLLAIKQHLKEAVSLIDSLLVLKPESDLAENDKREAEIKKVRNRVPLWFQNKTQINSRILIAYFYLYMQNNQVLYSELEDTAQIETFKNNFDQMCNFGERNHAKVFDKNGNDVFLWEPVKDFIIDCYKKSLS